MQGRVEQLAGAARVVAREDAARAVAAVRRRRETDEQEPRRAGRRSPGPGEPSRPIAVPRDLRASDTLPPVDQTGATPTGRDVRDEVPQAVRPVIRARPARPRPPCVDADFAAGPPARPVLVPGSTAKRPSASAVATGWRLASRRGSRAARPRPSPDERSRPATRSSRRGPARRHARASGRQGRARADPRAARSGSPAARARAPRHARRRVAVPAWRAQAGQAAAHPQPSKASIGPTRSSRRSTALAASDRSHPVPASGAAGRARAAYRCRAHESGQRRPRSAQADHAPQGPRWRRESRGSTSVSSTAGAGLRRVLERQDGGLTAAVPKSARWPRGWARREAAQRGPGIRHSGEPERRRARASPDLRPTTSKPRNT